MRFILLLLLLPAFAQAQDAVAVPPGCAQQATYDQAFDLYADHDYAGAITALERVVAECPDLAGAQDLLRHARARVEASSPHDLSSPRWTQPPTQYEVTPPPPATHDQPSDLARVELTITEGFFGVFQGIWLCGWAVSGSLGSGGGCDSVGIAGSALLGAALFAGATFGLTLDGVTEGQATAVESATFFGNALGLSVWTAANAPGTRTGDDRALALPPIIAGQLAGAGAGALIALFARPSAGHVALASSSGLWAGAMAAFLSLGVQQTVDRAGGYDAWMFGASQLIAVPIGLAAGIVGGFFHRTDRGRMLLVDLGTAISGGLGALFALLTNAGGDNYGEHVGFWEAAMLPIGFGLTMALSTLLDVPADVAQHVRLLPGGPGGPGLTAVITF